MRKSFVLALLAILAFSPTAQAQVINLEGKWKVNYTDDQAFASPDYDDSSWQTVTVPGEWTSDTKEHSGSGWLRFKFRVPDSIKSQDMVLEFGNVDDADQTFLNGEPVGAGSGWNKPRAYAIPSSTINFGGENCLAVKVMNNGGGGGICTPPVLLRPVKEEERDKLVYFSPKFRKPVFSMEERNAMPKSRPFEFTWVKKGNIFAPRINGRGLWGSSCQFNNAPLCQAVYEAPILATQGWNNLRLGVRPVGYTLEDWIEVTRTFDKLGIASIWGAYAMSNSFIARVLGMEEDALGDSDNIVLENGERKGGFGGMGSLGNPWNPDFLKNSDAMWEKMATAMQFKSAIGFQVTNEINMANGSYDPYARAAWQTFLRELFQDKTPAADSNGDGAYFNKAYGTAYKTWDEVELFRSADFEDRAKQTLKDIWLGTTYAGYIQRQAAVIHRHKPDAMVGASICAPLSAPVDLSLVCAMPDVNTSYINTYGCWLGGGLLMSAISNTYGCPTIASEINYPIGNYEQMKWTLLTMLPFYEGFQWFCYVNRDGTEPLEEEMVTEYGGKYGMIDQGKKEEFAGDGDPKAAGTVKVAVKYDERFPAFGQLAPFIGKLDYAVDPSILWISASGYRPDYEEDHRESHMFRAHVTSDMAMMVKPDALSLENRRVVIYRNVESPCLSKSIHRKLADYVKKGGTVVTGAYFIGAGKTIRGEDNSATWWEGLKLARGTFSAEGSTKITIGDETIEVAGTHEYLTATSPNITTIGQITDSTGATYPLAFIRNEGKGKWVLINFPGIFRMSERVGGWNQAKFDSRFRVLRTIVNDCAGVKLPYRYEMQVYPGEKCGLAIREGVPTGTPEVTGSRPTFKASGPTVAFEIFQKKVFGGPFLTPNDGQIEIPEVLGQGEARLWTLKPYGKPIVLYADGTERGHGRTDDGIFQNGQLRFEFAEEAYISSPKRPTAVIVNGAQVPFEYNEADQLLIIRRTGLATEAVVKYN